MKLSTIKNIDLGLTVGGVVGTIFWDYSLGAPAGLAVVNSLTPEHYSYLSSVWHSGGDLGFALMLGVWAFLPLIPMLVFKFAYRKRLGFLSLREQLKQWRDGDEVWDDGFKSGFRAAEKLEQQGAK